MAKQNFREWGLHLEELFDRQCLHVGVIQRYLEAAYRYGYNDGAGIIDPMDEVHKATDDWWPV